MEPNLNYPTVCMFVGRLYLETQLEIQKLKSESESGKSAEPFRQQALKLQSKVEELEKENAFLQNKLECYEREPISDK